MIVGIDTETTGLSCEDDEILQISFVDGQGAELFNEYVKPKHHHEWPKAEAVNHISPAQVQDLPTIDAHIERIVDLLEQSEKIVGYNTCFDLGFIAKAAGKDYFWLERMMIKSVDVMRQFAEVYGEWSEKYQDYRFQKLTFCAAHYDYVWTHGPHDSLEDAKATVYCWPLVEADLKRLEKEKSESLSVRLSNARQQATTANTEIPEPLAEKTELATYDSSLSSIPASGYELFYDPMPAHALQQKTGWNLAWGSDNHNLNGDTWIVYRSVSDLPKPLQRVVPKLEHETVSDSLSDCLKTAQQKADIASKQLPDQSAVPTHSDNERER